MSQIVSPPWEIERDRHGLMFSGPLEVGEMVEVVPLADYERDVLRLAQEASELKVRLFRVLGEVSKAEQLLSPGMRAGTAEAKAILRVLLADNGTLAE